MRCGRAILLLALGLALAGCAYEERTSPCVCGDWRTIGPETPEQGEMTT